MKNYYNSPAMEKINLSTNDVIATSNLLDNLFSDPFDGSKKEQGI